MITSIQKVLRIKELQGTKSITEIAKELGLERHTISKWFKRDYLPGELLSKKAKVRNNPFANLNNRDCMYFLGLICTDGGLYKRCIDLALKEADLDIMEKYKIFLGSNVNILKVSKKMGDKIFYSNRICFRNKEVYDYLHSLNITTNKTFTLSPNFPFTWDFIRGVIDGDGSFGFYQQRTPRIHIVTASSSFKDQLLSFFNSSNITLNLNQIERNGRIYYNLVTNKKDTVLKIINYLYNDTETFINRKFQTAEYLRNQILQTHQIQGTSVKES